MLCQADGDALVRSLNEQASEVMAAAKIPTLDLHAAIIGKCGAAPQKSCFGSAGCYCPHCGGNSGVGYSWLVNSTIAPAMRKLLSDDAEASTAAPPPPPLLGKCSDTPAVIPDPLKPGGHVRVPSGNYVFWPNCGIAGHDLANNATAVCACCHSCD